MKKKVFELKQGDFTVLVNAEGLGSHLAAGDLKRAQFLPLLPEVLTDPYEALSATPTQQEEESVKKETDKNAKATADFAAL